MLYSIEHTYYIVKEGEWNEKNQFIHILSICEIAFTAKADNQEDTNVHIYPVDYVTTIVYLVTYTWYLNNTSY